MKTPDQFPEGFYEAIKYILMMKGLSPMWKTIIIVALVALIAVIFAPDELLAQEEGKNYVISGIYVNNGKLYGLFGYAHQASPTISYFIQSESGGDEYAFGGFPVYTVGLSKRITLGALLGPQVEIIQENPSTSETVAYLGATTGIVAALQLSERTGIWVAARYMFIEESVKPFKIGIGLILDID